MKKKTKSLENITNNFPITNEEYELMDSKFGNLCYYAAWQLKKKNSQNYFSQDPLGEDDVQDLRIALLRAGSYYKRQTYIVNCLESLSSHVVDPLSVEMSAFLSKMWKNRRQGGTGKRFGKYHEEILDRLVYKNVPKKHRPDRDAPLVLDATFATYCKQIIWNAQKSLGKKITRDKSVSTGMVSLSEYDYLCSD